MNPQNRDPFNLFQEIYRVIPGEMQHTFYLLRYVLDEVQIHFYQSHEDSVLLRVQLNGCLQYVCCL